jgi:Domain of unknown function (DUF4349)
MTTSEIVDELRATRPRAGEPLRLHVLTLASQPVPAEPSLRDRLLRHRRLALLVPAAAGLAVAAAVAIGVTRPQPAARDAASVPTTADRAADAATPFGAEAATAPPNTSGATARKATPGPTVGRAQRYVASLTLAVEDTDALSEATQRALVVARDLGGFVASVRYATGEDGSASVTLRVPSARASHAVTRLSELGTIVSQNVQIDDLQESLDGLDRAIEQLHGRIARFTTRLRTEELDPATRARLLEERAQAQAQLRELRASRSATSAEARLATIQLELRAEDMGGATAPSSRLDRALDRALEVLAWEAVGALAIAVAVAPLAIVAAAMWAARRVRRRRDEDQLLAAS